ASSEGEFGARERTRTSTTLRSLAPEASASASSATRARVKRAGLMGANRLRGIFNSARGLVLCQRGPNALEKRGVSTDKCESRVGGAASVFPIVNPRNFYLRWYTPRLETRTTLLPALESGRHCGPVHTEVAMESTLTPPVFYLLIVWGIVTSVFVILLIWRGLLSSHEDDQIFLDAAEEHMAREQRELVAKITTLSRPLLITGILSGALLLL